jgi:hypothetical protein
MIILGFYLYTKNCLSVYKHMHKDATTKNGPFIFIGPQTDHVFTITIHSLTGKLNKMSV